MLALLLISAVALAGPDDDPVEALHYRLMRVQGVDTFVGDGDRGVASRAADLDGLPRLESEYWRSVEALLLREHAPEIDGLGAAALDPRLAVRGELRVAAGGGRTQGLIGDGEPGLVSPRARVAASATTAWWEARVEAEARAELGGGVDMGLPLTGYWAGFRHGPWRIGFGQERRWLGPGRHGALILGDDAWPFPAGVASAQPRLGKAGRLSVEVGAGWLQRPRDDVQRPGLLWMDARWQPRPWLEIGGSRASLFAGEGRPWPSLGQLILPLDPHVYDDPDRLEPDQDEIAALDVRVTAPLRLLPLGPLDYLDIYWQYGGDDLIMRELGPLPMPSLAGVANLLGGELCAGPVALNLEYARLMDDYFRWYRGHRVYHEGFTQDGRSLGHLNGGDSETWWGALSVTPGPWGGQLSAEWVRRVGVIEVVQDSVFTTLVEERRRRGTASLFWARPDGGVLEAGYTLERLEGEDFVPGADDWTHRVWVGFSTSPVRVERP